MDRSLAPHLYAAVHGRDLVLLDLTSGQYELLAGIGAHIRLSADARRLTIQDAALGESLEALELFTEQPTAPIRPIPPLPGCTAPLHDPVRLALADRAWMAAGWLDMLAHYHGRSFSWLVRSAEARPAGAQRFSSDHYARAAAVFDRLSVWIPFQGDCFYRSYMLLRRLGEAGSAVDWVFGVRTWPFLAHCWLQVGDMVLTDEAERLVMFSPILAI